MAVVTMEPDVAVPPEGQSGYLVESRQPLASLLFVAPLLATYEAGLIVFGPAAVRNGAEVWLRYLLDVIGFGQYFLLPVLTVGILLAWHHTTHHPWRPSRGLFYAMAVEATLFALCLRGILWLQGSLLQIAGSQPNGAASGWTSEALRLLRTGIGYLGAGIYEELLFRLVLLSLLLGLLRLWHLSASGGTVLAVVLSSLIFSAAHYVVPGGDVLHWFTFLFRFLAGAFFAMLYLYRGFGIAVGAHAGYDLLVGLH